MLATPDTSHITECVYEPAEDSYLLMDSLIGDADFLHNRFNRRDAALPPPLITEVCVGSGVVLAFALSNAKSIFGRDDVLGFGVDVNLLAAQAACITASKALSARSGNHHKPSAFLDACLADLATPLRDNMIDVLLCNPPYVPSEDVPSVPDASLDAMSTTFRLQALATDGGVDGMEVTDRLIESLPRVMSRRGVVYLLLCAQNRPEDVMERIRRLEDGRRWKAEIVLRRSDGFEKLVIVRIWREIDDAVP